MRRLIIPGADDHRGQRAAQYVRMSTDHQKYSIDNQEEIIAAYAALHNFTIIRKYTDAGRSGLRFEGRGALQQLISDIVARSADFGVVLVYDVSRWGRFQDADESAHYEFICKQGGVTVHYCAEQFANDGSLIATIVKGMKRAMAAEFSRELSVKVLQGQKRLSSLGFRRGGSAGYGLRRLLVDENKRPKQILEFGVEKNLQTDKVILVPGPPEEVAVVRDIFQMFVHKKTPVSYIAKVLNERGIQNSWGNRWTTNNVFFVLRNEDYIGNLVYNKVSEPLRTKRRKNPKSEWIRVRGAYQRIIDDDLFHSAQTILQGHWTYTDNELLDYLTAWLCVHGHLSVSVIKQRKCGPAYPTYCYRFGRLSNAWRAIGYVKHRNPVVVGDPAYIAKRSKRPQKRFARRQFKFRYRTE